MYPLTQARFPPSTRFEQFLIYLNKFGAFFYQRITSFSNVKLSEQEKKYGTTIGIGARYTSFPSFFIAIRDTRVSFYAYRFESHGNVLLRIILTIFFFLLQKLYHGLETWTQSGEKSAADWKVRSFLSIQSTVDVFLSTSLCSSIRVEYARSRIGAGLLSFLECTPRNGEQFGKCDETTVIEL